MGIPDSSISQLIAKLRSWVSWGGGNISGVSKEYWMPDNSCRMCYECDLRFSVLNRRHHCRSCGRVFCSKCMQDPNGISSHGEDREQLKFCKFCFQAIGRNSVPEFDEKLDLLMSPGRGFDVAQENYRNKPLQIDKLANFLERHRGSSSGGPTSCATSSIDPLSPISFGCNASRSDEEDRDDDRKHILGPSIEYSHDVSDVHGSSINTGNELYNFNSVASGPLDSPLLMTSSPRTDNSLHPERVQSPSLQNDSLLNQESRDLSRRLDNDLEDIEPADDSTDLSIFHNQSQGVEQPLDFENNGFIWFPPPPEDEEDDADSNFFEYDDEDDEIGDSSAVFSSSSFNSEAISSKEEPNDGQKEPLRAVVHGHFRALVLQLLKGEGICAGGDIGGQWLEIVSALAWEAANFMRPDTSRGGSMDPGNYVKVKCAASGDPCESTLIRGIVCTKNVKHKRMTAQYRNPRLLLLGGALEYQRVPNQLASMDTLLQQEIDHLKMAVAKIEAHRPNVLLVEKSVSSYAQEYLLAKEISLVLNVKKQLLERIARCTGAQIIPSIDNLASARLGNCEVFRLEKVTEEISTPNQPNKRSTKTLMFFEGCPRRLGCTILLRGKSLEELKKVKHVVQYALFAAYHLSLETSFLADEGASLPKVPLKPSIAIPERPKTSDRSISMISLASVSPPGEIMVDEHQGVCFRSKLGTLSLLETSNISSRTGIMGTGSELEEWEAANEHYTFSSVDLVSDDNVNFETQWNKLQNRTMLAFGEDLAKPSPIEAPVEEEDTVSNHGPAVEACDFQDNQAPAEYFSTADNNQSILVSLSSRCVLKGTVCERSQLFRIKFYGSFDKPLGRFLRDDLFDQRSFCRSCNEPAEAHVRCYTHQQGSLTISVKRLPSLKLPGERDGKIWMWHRCLKCALKDGVPPASRRVVMSDAAWGLSFGKFLELSFSNHATANRVASCGHSLQRDCLRYYGFGSMVAFFRYSPIDILSVRLPPLMLDFDGQYQQEWIQIEAVEVSKNMGLMHAEVFDVLQGIEQKLVMAGFESSKTNTLLSHINELKDMLKQERNEYEEMLRLSAEDNSDFAQVTSDILELNRVRRCLLIDSYMWDRRLSLLHSFLKSKSPLSVAESVVSPKLKMSRNDSFSSDGSPGCGPEDNDIKSLPITENSGEQVLSKGKDDQNLELSESVSNEHVKVKIPHEELETNGCEASVENKSLDSLPSPASNLSHKIDLAWTGSGQPNEPKTASTSPTKGLENVHHRRVMPPVRVHSFDSGLRFHDKVHKGLSPASLHSSSVRSFHASGDFGSLVHDPISNRGRSYTQTTPLANQNLKFIFGHTPLFVTLTSRMVSDGARLILPLVGSNNVVIAVYDNEPTSIIAYALSSKEFVDYMADRLEGHEIWNDDNSREDDLGHVSGPQRAFSTLSAWQSFSSVDSDDVQFRSYGSYGSDDASLMRGAHVFPDSKRTPHVRISFGDESSLPSGKVKFSVTSYFAKQFDALRRKCCPSEIDFLRSLSRCRRWSAQGGKSNVYFAKTLDERFIIKQVTKTELESFEEFAPQYFKHLMDSLGSGNPTCLAKVLGIYQVTIKHLKGGKEVKMDLMVMENLFFGRSISRVYDLKGSARSRYNSDTTGGNNVLLDLNLLEALRTKPLFLGSKAKRTLERAVWNDTSFLASIDVMDYSLLVGVDEERKELVLGIIDFIRQYTWDKHLETWVKASGILGGPKNASPTVISPKQYKKRFRKAMSTYFLTVPDQWSL